MIKKMTIVIIVFISCFEIRGFAQTQIVKPDLSDRNNFHVVNKNITIINDQGKTTVHLDGRPNNGVAWINGVNFAKGTIEFDKKGKNVLQQSFIGIAFHGVDDSTYDAVYFRPFNFQSPDTVRKSHSVQYISSPQYDWSVLREKYPGKYENTLTTMIDPESWFHVKVVVDAGNITVYLNGDKKPSLVVQPISNRTTGKVGFWVGNNSDGDFSNLSIQNN